VTTATRVAIAGIATCGLVIAFATARSSAAAEPYAYPVADPLLATVIGTHRGDSVRLPDSVASAPMLIERVDPQWIPRVFWDQSKIRFSVAKQRKRAPLVFLIAGTGSRYSSAKMEFLQALLWGAGHHVVALSSPTHPDFVLTASQSHMPGYMPADVTDLYSLMRRILDLLGDEIDVSGVGLAGFSLGATQAAFVAERDSRHRALDLRRVMLINPAVSVFDSVETLDRMYAQSLVDGTGSSDRLIADLFRRVTPYLHQRGRSRVDDELLYALAEGDALETRELGGIVSAVFRMALANMVFTADVMTGGGHIVAPGTRPGASAPLTGYLERALRFTFTRYLDEMLLPYWQKRSAALDRQALVAAASLETIAPYLSSAKHVGVMTNADDFILTDAHLEFLRHTFADRAKVYPHGGHGGNLAFRDNAEHVVRFFDAIRGREP
jgi:acetyl esterase/lipase